MGGGLIQLVAYGSQDMYITGNPQITFFKSVYRRHTNFAIESIKTIFNGSTNFGQEIHAKVDKSGDLIHKMYLQIRIPAVELKTDDTSEYIGFRWLNWLGHILVDDVELSIGGQKIDRHTGDWFHIWNELTQNAEQGPAYAEMVGNVPKLTQVQSCNTSSSTTTDAYTLYIPLQFWFNRNPGLALPLIALQHHDIVLKVQLRSLENCIWASKQTGETYNDEVGQVVFSTKPALESVNLYTDYIFLDTAERRRFSQVQHEYLIEQVQIKNVTIQAGDTSPSTKFTFNHPVKEMIWTIQPIEYRDSSRTQNKGGRQYFNFTDSWDYSGFTGTPEGYFGPGMAGGRGNQNFFHGIPSIKLYGDLNSNNAWNTTSSSITDSTTAGYSYLSNYTESGGTNLYSNRTFEHLLGPALAQPTTGNSTGLLSATSNQMSINDSGRNPVVNGKLVLNGNDRFTIREGFYFNVVQPYQHHTGSPAPGINVYSFSLKPEDYQPSGTCNFSRIDNSTLDLTLTNATTLNRAAELTIYAVNYNILRIMSGMGGLAYSN